MKKRVVLLLIVVFMIALLTGCGSPRLANFNDISLSELRTVINEKLDEEEATQTITEFVAEDDDINGVEYTNYVSEMGEFIEVEINKFGTADEYLVVSVSLAEAPADEREFQLNEGLALLDSLISTVDPGYDFFTIYDSVGDGLICHSDNYMYMLFITDDSIGLFIQQSGE